MEEPEEKTRTDRAFVLFGLRTLWGLWSDHRKTLVQCFCLLALGQLLMLGVPTCLAFVVDDLPSVVQHGPNPRFVALLATMLLIPVVNSAVLRYWREPRFYTSLVKAECGLPLQAQRKLLALSREYHDRENTGKKVAKINSSCTSFVAVSADLWWHLLPQVLALVIGAAIMLWIDWRLALVLYLPFVPSAMVFKRMLDRNASTWDAWYADHEKSTSRIAQSVTNVSTVQSFVQEGPELAATTAIRARMQELDLRTSDENRSAWFGTGLVMHLSYTAALCYGVVTAVYGSTRVGSLLYLATAGYGAVNALVGIMIDYQNVVRQLASIVRLRRLLDEPVTVANEAPGVVPSLTAGILQLKDVTYRYAGEQHAVVERLNLTITPGKMLALVGRSGAGKSTLVKLLARVYDPNDGTVLLDGCDVRQLDRDWYRRQFAVVQQDVDVFDATLRANVAYGCPAATDQEVWEALEAAHLAALVRNPSKMPKGLDTAVGERGVRLSGGERQRVGIARAYLSLLHGVQKLILDEATNELDSEAEAAIQAMVGKLHDVTIVAIAHRLSTIQHADVICVLDQGAIVERGTHEDLLRQNGLYAHLVELQQLGELRS